MQRLFKTNVNQTADALPKTVDAEIIFTSAPYIMYEQLKLDNNYQTYLEGVMLAEPVLGTGIKPTSYQKSFEFVVATESRVVNFQAANKQFSFLTILLVCDRNDQHISIYDSYNTELASTKIKSLQLENAPNAYSSFNTVKFDMSDAHDKSFLYMQFVVRYCWGSSIVLLSDYANNLTFEELPDLSNYFANSNEKFIIYQRRRKDYSDELEKINRDNSDLMITVTPKAATTKKMRLRVTGHYQGEYLYSLSNEGLIMNYKEYGVNKPNSIALDV